MTLGTTTTIIALCTPRGSGAIALLRLSGPQAFAIAQRISQTGKTNLLEAQSHTIHFGRVHDQHGEIIDQVMFLMMRGPKTFTGEDVVEITCHNNPFIIESIIDQALAFGACVAKPGEFAQRAFHHGKIDLLQAEAIHDVIHAQTQAALKKSLSQLEGTLSHTISLLEVELIRALAWCEASFEFLDEEQEFGSQIKEHLEKQQQLLHKALASFDAQKHLREGIRIALLGAVNAGKSSLFNTLIGKQRAIVSDIAGTTRDSIEAQITHNGSFWTLIDTAGLRTTRDVIEQEGIQRSYREAHLADIILLVIDGSRALTAQEADVYATLQQQYGNKIIQIITKSDCPQNQYSFAGLAVSTTAKTGIDDLIAQIQSKSDELLAKHDSPFLLNARQCAILRTLHTHLQTIIAQLSQPAVQYELVSFELRQALENLSELTGKSISEAGMDMVFKEFCVGK